MMDSMDPCYRAVEERTEIYACGAMRADPTADVGRRTPEPAFYKVC